MAEKYYPFDTGQGENVTQDEWTQMAKNFRRSGIAGDLGNTSLKVNPTSSVRTSAVSPGEAFLAGHQYFSDSTETVTHTVNGSGRPRLDLVVLRLNRATDRIYPAVLEGDPADNPKRPELTGFQNNFTGTADVGQQFDIPLAEVRVDHNVGKIPADKYSDIRWMAEFPTVTGSSENRNNYWGMRPWGTIHYEYDKDRWLGWSNNKWGMIAEFGAWRTYRPQIFWERANGALDEDTSRWETYGRYRWIADNTITFQSYCKINYDWNETSAPGGPRGHLTNPRILRVSLPVQAGHTAPVQQMLELAYFRISRPGDARTGHGFIWSADHDASRLMIQSEINSDGDVAAGNLDTVTENTPWSKGCHLRLSGTYETIGYGH